MDAARILVIDDEKAVRDLVALHLASEGHEVALAEDAVVGARLLLAQKFDLLIVKAQLPYWSGLEFTATLIADRDVVCPPIIITGDRELSSRARAMANACLVTPFLPAALFSAVAECLQPPSAYAGKRAPRRSGAGR